MSPDEMLRMALWSAVAPAVLAALVFGACRWILRRKESTVRNGAALALAVAVGYLAGHLAAAWPQFPPIEATDRVVWLAALSAVSALLARQTASRTWLRWLQGLVLADVVVAALVGPIFHETSQTWGGVLWIIGVGFGLAAYWANLDALSVRLPAVALGVPVAVLALGSAAALVASGSLVLGRLSTSLAASLAAVVVLDRKATALGNVAPAYSAILGALLLDGYVYSSLPALSAVILGTAPFLLWGSKLGLLERRPVWLRTAIATAAILVPVVAAIALARGEAPLPYEE